MVNVVFEWSGGCEGGGGCCGSGVGGGGGRLK